MSAAQSISNASAPYDPTKSGSSGSEKSPMGKESFMKLLVAQLGAQDPLNPQDSSEFVSQLTQFTSMEQLVNIKEGLDLLAITQTAATSAQMVSFIGKDVSFSADSFVMDEVGETENISFNLAENANSVDIVVKNEDGKVVRTAQAGAMGSGSQDFAFDGMNDEGGKLPEGTYTFEVVAKDKEGTRIDATTQSNGIVEAIVFESGYPELMMEDGRKITLSQVVQVLNGENSGTSVGSNDATPITNEQINSLIASNSELSVPGDQTEERGFF